MTHRETPSKTNTSLILYYSNSEGINIEESTEKPTNSDLKLKYYYTVLAFIILGFKTNYCSFAQAFCYAKIKARSDNVLISLTSLSRLKW